MFVYADNNATTSVAPEVVEAMLPYLKEEYFNPSSMYSQSEAAAAAIQTAREEIAFCLGRIAPEQLLFTSCATESNNTAIFGAMAANPKRKHIITTAVEHPSVFEVCKEAERRGCEVTFLPVGHDGCLSTADFVRALRPDTLMVSIMHANNETGVVFPIEDLARIAKETDPKILFHTDATQSLGKLEVNLKENLQHVDLLSFSGHKLHGPKGIGALYVKRGTPCRPFLYGGHQEKGRRGGTENVPYIAGLGVACKLARSSVAEEGRISALRDRLETSLAESIPYLEINGKGAERLPNTLNLAVHCVEGEAILYQLNAEGICASSGSACTSGSLDPSHVLKAMDLPFTAIHGSVRFSLSRYTTEEEVDHIITVFPEIIANLRKLSPFWDNKEKKPKEMD
ncbi:MAG: cysteine desulfurase NifS [Planctomycetota bacterium]